MTTAVRTSRQRAAVLIVVALLFATMLSTQAGAQPTATPTPTGEFLCSVPNNVAPDGRPCNDDDGCSGGVCVIAQGVCNGGTDDGAICDCNGGSCSATPACVDDPTFGTCKLGVFAGVCCDVTFNCAGNRPCVGAQKVCLAGIDKGFSCLNDGQCPSSSCVSTGKFCDGGDFDSFSCVDNVDCPGTSPTPPGACIGSSVTPPTPTPTRGTPTRTPTHGTPTSSPTPGAPSPTRSRTATVSLTVAPTKTAARTPIPGPTAQLAQAITESATSLTLDDARAFPGTCGNIQIEDEQLSYLGKSDQTLTELGRGVAGTKAAEHKLGAMVTYLVPTGPVTCQIVAQGGGCSIHAPEQGRAPVVLMGVALAAWVLRKRRGR